MQVAMLERSSGVGDNATELRIILSEWTLISITDPVTCTTTEEDTIIRGAEGQ